MNRNVNETENIKKSYRLGVIVGRFQDLHKGHEMIISKAVELCDEVGVFIGSAQESGTNKNPFPYELREELLRNVFGDRIRIYPLPDMGLGNVPAWGDFVLWNVSERFGRYPDLLISGKEGRRIDWFDNAARLAISELYVPKSIDISGTRMREMFLNDEEEEWRKYTNPANWHEYGKLRELFLLAKDRTETNSI